MFELGPERLFDFSRYPMRREGHFTWKEIYMQGAGPILHGECGRPSRKGSRGRLKQSLSVSLSSILQTEPCSRKGTSGNEDMSLPFKNKT